MEVSGVVFRPFPCFTGAGIETQSSSKLTFPSDAGNGVSGRIRILGGRGGRVGCVRGRMDNGHLQYYVAPTASMKKEKKKNKSEKEIVKKKLKLVKGLAKDLLNFSSMGFGVDGGEGLVAEVKGKKISEAAEILLAQLQQLRAEEKEIKRKRTEEKARLKGIRCEESSSCTLSSDSVGGEVVNMSLVRNGDINELKVNEQQIEILGEEATSTSPTILIQEQRTTVQVEGILDQNVHINGKESSNNRVSCCNGSSISESSLVVAASANKIEVCMGGKCKKLGAPALMEEFERMVGVEGAVVGCKCMGKCRDGPNVRVVNQCSIGVAEKDNGSVSVHTTTATTTNPLCVGVSLEDVGVIVGNFFGDGRKELGLMAA